ncbi:MAG: carboxypeptidase-like regulatory domain-containing protein [Flavobacteriaceae bacterium]|nr:carboxypeptidase-like regulatory domain-containing protein [Flavobacteriaceae bacterium]
MIICKFFTYLICFTCVGTVCAQTVFRGTVTDSLHQPISLVNVYLQPAEKEVIVAYSITDNDGRYEIVFDKTGIYKLHISSLAFKTVIISVTIDSLNPPRQIINNVRLQPQKMELNEVIVNANLPVVVKKDTISFKADAYADGTETVVEDLLKKIPGLEVDSQGNIKVNGKSIEKVMIDGDDLFEKGYKLLTKNLNAGVIDRVEVYDHYSDNPLLKDVEDSDKVALNLTLKEDKKQQLFGNATLGGGTDDFYENRLNLISFLKKSKYFFFGNLNNTGLDPTGDISQMSGNSFASGNRIADNNSAPEVMSLLASRPSLKDAYINFNNAEMASLSSITSLSEKTKLKTLGFFTADENDFFRDQTLDFFGPGEAFTNTEKYRLRKKTKLGFVKTDLTSNLSKTKLLEYSGNISVGNQKTNTQLLFNGSPTEENLDHDPLSIDQYVSYTNKLRKNRALILSAQYVHDEKPQNYVADTFLLGKLFPNNTTATRTAQHAATNTNAFAAEARWITNNDSSNWELKAGYHYTSDRLNNTLLLGDDASLQAVDSLYRNRINLNQNDFYGSIRYRKNLGRLKISAKTELHQLFARVENDLDANQTNPLYWSGQMSGEYKFSNISLLTASYNLNTNNSDLLNVTNGFVLNNYRNLSRGFGKFEQLQNQFLFVNYTYGGFLSGFTLNSAFVYNRESDYFGNISRIEPEFSTSELALLRNRESYSYNLQSDYFIKAISSNLKAKFNYANTHFQNFVNQSGKRSIESQNINFGGELRSAFLGLFNYHIGSEWQYSEVKFSGKSTRTDNLTFLDLYFNIHKNTTIKLQNDRYFFGNLDGDSSFYFTELSVQYKLKESGLNFELVGHNLLNTNNLQNSNIGDTSTSLTDFRLIPRYIMLKVGFRF